MLRRKHSRGIGRFETSMPVGERFDIPRVNARLCYDINVSGGV